jgi:hypothetical protein
MRWALPRSCNTRHLDSGIAHNQGHGALRDQREHEAPKRHCALW